MRRNVSNPAGDSQKEHTVHIPPDLHKKRLLTLIVLLTLSLTSTLHAASITGRVERVIDGDTIVVGTNIVRLAEIDAPEIKTTHGPKSKAAMSDMILHRTVVVQWKRRGRYRRIIGPLGSNHDNQFTPNRLTPFGSSILGVRSDFYPRKSTVSIPDT